MRFADTRKIKTRTETLQAQKTFIEAMLSKIGEQDERFAQIEQALRGRVGAIDDALGDEDKLSDFPLDGRAGETSIVSVGPTGDCVALPLGRLNSRELDALSELVRRVGGRS